jgi:hypothetical protein
MKVWREYSAPLKAGQTVIEIINAGQGGYDQAHGSGRQRFGDRSLDRKRRPTRWCSISTTGTGGAWR